MVSVTVRSMIVSKVRLELCNLAYGVSVVQGGLAISENYLVMSFPRLTVILQHLISTSTKSLAIFSSPIRWKESLFHSHSARATV